MSNTIPKWTAEREASLTKLVGAAKAGTPVTQSAVEKAATQLETTTRSISSKLRKMGYEVTPVSKVKNPKFSEAQTKELEGLVKRESGRHTYSEIAAMLFDGEFSSKEVQGKLLSMELTKNVKATVSAVVARTYTDAETAKVLKMINDGAFVEDIAKALGKEVSSIRGKALSLMTKHGNAMPKQRDSHAKDTKDILGSIENVEEKTVEELAEILQTTERGVKTMLTRRKLVCKNYDGVKKSAAADKRKG